VVDRAYALDVAASVGEYHRDKLEAIREEMGSAYERSVIDLAFDEGKTEATEITAADADGGGEDPWDALIDGEPVTVDADEIPTGGRSGIPEAVDQIDAIDSTNRVSKPDVLERDRARQACRGLYPPVAAGPGRLRSLL